MRSIKLLATAIAVASALASTQSFAEEKVEKKNPWRMSEIDYGHSFSALSLNRAAEPTYNPYYSHAFSFRPRWYFGEMFYAGGRFDLEQEITNSDDTTRYREWLAGDLQLDFGFAGYTEPRTGIKVAGLLRFVLPTSKAAAASTLWFQIAPSVTVSRKFAVLEGLNVALTGRLGRNLHSYTTAQFDAPAIACGDPDSVACGNFIQTGVRNVQWGYLFGPRVTFEPIKDLSIDTMFLFVRNVVYPLTPFTEGGALLSDAGDVRTRYSQWFTFSASYPVWEFVSASAGVSTLYPELKSDSTYRTPFLNRYTVFEVGLGFDVDGAVSLFQ